MIRSKKKHLTQPTIYDTILPIESIDKMDDKVIMTPKFQSPRKLMFCD